MPKEPEILLDRRGTAGVVTLNRPAALNAVTRAMVRTLREALEDWRHDGAVSRIILTAAAGRAFSAGGDLRHIYEAGRAGRQEESIAFWREEYALNAAIKHYPKPYVALIDGIVMGGGVGISVHGSHRVAGDRFEFAMPEVGIGFFPDVGATWFLPRLPGEIGTYCALTGERLKTADALAAGVATRRVVSARFTELVEALCGAVSVDAILAAFAEPVGQAEQGPVAAHRRAIDRIFAAASVEEILAQLDVEAVAASSDARWAGEAAAAIRAKAPLSLKIALAQMRRGRNWSAYGHDFYEGIRAVIIDKDNRPRWRPATLADATAESVERHFAPLESELALP